MYRHALYDDLVPAAKLLLQHLVPILTNTLNDARTRKDFSIPAMKTAWAEDCTNRCRKFSTAPQEYMTVYAMQNMDPKALVTETETAATADPGPSSAGIQIVPLALNFEDVDRDLTTIPEVSVESASVLQDAPAALPPAPVPVDNYFDDYYSKSDSDAEVTPPPAAVDPASPANEASPPIRDNARRVVPRIGEKDTATEALQDDDLIGALTPPTQRKHKVRRQHSLSHLSFSKCHRRVVTILTHPH